MRRKSIFLIAISLFLQIAMAGCGPSISKEVLKSADQTITFEKLIAAPDKYQGKTVLLGGTIVKTINLADETLVEILQQPLDSSKRPKAPEASKGRFLMSFKEFKDPAIHGKGKPVTVVGDVIGSKTMPLGETTYTYPVIAPKEYYIWRPYGGPEFHIGIGIFKSF